MGNWGLIFFSEEIAQLEAYKKTLSNAAEIAKVDEAISLLKQRSK